MGGQIDAGLRHLLQEAEPADLLHHGAADRGRERVAVEGAALVAMLEAAHVLVRDQRAERDAAAEPLAERHDVGRDAGMLEAEEFSGAADAGLDLVEDQQRCRCAW